MRRPPWRKLFSHVAAVAVIVLTLLAISHEASAQVQFTDYVLRQWSLMYREFSTEFMVCVYGVRFDNGARVLAYGIPAHMLPSASTDSSAQTHPNGGCIMQREDELIAFAHSHPNGGCYQSAPDFAGFMLGSYEFAIVVCGEGKFYVNGKRSAPAVCTFDAEATPVALACEPYDPEEHNDAETHQDRERPTDAQDGAQDDRRSTLNRPQGRDTQADTPDQVS